MWIGFCVISGSAASHIERINSMEQQPNDKQSTRSAAIAALLAVSAGAGIGYALMLATGNNAVGIGIAGPIALLVNNFVRNMLRTGKK
jgi:hypothetical protein